MSNQTASDNTTHISGYYNGNKWPIQLVISKLGLTLHLAKGEFILDRKGRKVNDPFFEVYANNKQLSRELSDDPVEVIFVPQLDQNPQPKGHNPVRAASKFELDARGIRQPVMPVSAIAEHAPVLSTDPVRGMSMEDARKLGLARKVREVPEDYGETDTSGAPPRVPPQIRYAIDPSMLKKAPPLPKELVELKGVSDTSTRTQIISQLAKSSTTSAAPASANAFLNKTSVDSPANAPLVAGTPAKRLSAPQPAPVVEELMPDDVPDPVQEENEPEGEVIAAEPLLQAGLPEPDLAELKEAKVEEEEEVLPPPVRPMAAKDRYICMSCGSPFKFRSQLSTHAKNQHKDNYVAIMAVYPPS